MRHRRKGRILGRNPNHQRALLRSLATALILTEGEYDYDPSDKTASKPPKVKGRIITTIQKAKEVRPLVERCVTIAIRALPQLEAAAQLEPEGERNSEEWKKWRHGPGWAEWNRAVAPVLAARRRTLQLLGSKQAVQILFNEIAPRFSDRPGGYTRVLRLAKPRLGDAGIRAILEFVGVHDRKRRAAARPAFEAETAAPAPAVESPASENTAEAPATESAQ
jgi:large subunit ribosomal protein L17